MPSPLGLTDRISNSSVGNYKVIENKGVRSLFGPGQFSPYPTQTEGSSGNVTKISTPNEIHADENSDLTIDSIVRYTSQYPSMKLSYSDFAYLKDVGVFPNNRLIIARRFPGPVGNDLTSIKEPPMATLISWVKDGEDFITLNYNEKWVEAEASFEKVLNDLGEDVKLSGDNSSKIGSAGAKGFDLIPFPGLMEGIQQNFLKELGLSDNGAGSLPLGNPNLIREARRRYTVSKGDPGSGLEAKFTVKMTVEYEQKFINGVDPTLVYLDIIQNALTFGTSDAVFQFNGAFAKGTSDIISNLISGNVGAILKGIEAFVNKLIDVATRFAKDLIEKLIDPPDEEKPDAGNLADLFKTAFKNTVGAVIGKYKVRLLGITNALTGSPSTPWHVTIGNPKRPIFSSGDMECTEVTLTLGKSLAFNDLPSSIKIEFNLQNARSMGAYELFNRLNTGKGRSYTRVSKSFVETVDKKTGQNTSTNENSSTGTQSYVDPYELKGSNGSSWFKSSDPTSNGTKDPASAPTTTPKEGSTTDSGVNNNITNSNIVNPLPATGQ